MADVPNCKSSPVEALYFFNIYDLRDAWYHQAKENSRLYDQF